jgi:hypothetical protein
MPQNGFGPPMMGQLASSASPVGQAGTLRDLTGALNHDKQAHST